MNLIANLNNFRHRANLISTVLLKPSPLLLLYYLMLSHSFFFFFCLFAFSRAAPAAYGGSQARGLIGAVDTGLCHSHSNAGSELCMRPTPQLTATLDP